MSVEIVISVAKAALNTCKYATECHEEAIRIGQRLTFMLSRTPSWSSILRNDPQLSQRMSDSLRDIFLCVQAASSERNNWNGRIRSFISSKSLIEEMKSAEENLDRLLRDLQVELNSIILNKISLGFESIAVLLEKYAATQLDSESNQTLQNEIDNVLADCHQGCFTQSEDGFSQALFTRPPEALDAVDEIDLNDLSYEEIDERRVGKGAFASVYSGLWKNKQVAVKVFDFDSNLLRDIPDEELKPEIDQIIEEVQLMRKCCLHPNVVEIFGCCINDLHAMKPLIVMELMETTLHTMLHRRNNNGDDLLPYKQRVNLLIGIASAIEFLHLQGIIHHDVKPKNILVNKEGTIAKLSDFGETKVKELHTTRQHFSDSLNYKQAGGTVSYQAPEVLEGIVRESSRVSEMYSFGVTLWECLTCQVPHSGKRESDITVLALTHKDKPMLEIPSDPPDELLSADERHAWKILQMTATQCLSRKREDRPNASMALVMLEGSSINQVRVTSVSKHNDKRILKIKLPLILALVITTVITVALYLAISNSKSKNKARKNSQEQTEYPIDTQANPATSTPNSSEANARTPCSRCFQAKEELQSALSMYMVVGDAVSDEHDCDINDWCVDFIVDFSNLFENMLDFNEDISRWNTSSALYMSRMFYNAKSFDQAIGKWDTSKVTDMSFMFENAENFNQAIGEWDVSSVSSVEGMFRYARSFNADITGWNTSSVRNMAELFYHASSFNQEIGQWDTSNVVNMSALFYNAGKFNSDVSRWNTMSVTDMSNLFFAATVFDQKIGNWNTSSVKTMFRMMIAPSFNQAIGDWDTSNVINMQSMFWMAYNFNQPIGNWNTSSVQRMKYMFTSATKFNQDISGWDVSKVVDVSYMFSNASSFNKSLCAWGDRLSSATSTFYMFWNTSCIVTADPNMMLKSPFCHACLTN